MQSAHRSITSTAWRFGVALLATAAALAGCVALLATAAALAGCVAEEDTTPEAAICLNCGSHPPPPPPPPPKQGSGTGATPTPLPATSLPQGLTCQLQYGYSSWGNFVDEGADCRSAYDASGNLIGPTSGWLDPSNGDDGAFNDGDIGAPTNSGFGHMEWGSSAVPASQSTLFALPQGTTCGFHHTQVSPGRTCMGIDPLVGCPVGWTQRSHFDDSSGNGYFVWCEYQDPNNFCEDATCVRNALYAGYACGTSSNTDVPGYGSCNHLPTNSGTNCPAGAVQSPYFDAGRPAGQGLGWCHWNEP